MPHIEIGVRRYAAPPDPKELARTRNEEDSAVLARVREEVNLLGGDDKDVSADYTVLPTDRYLFVDTSGGAIALTLPSLDGLAGKHFTVIRDGGSAVTVLDDDGGTVDTLSTDGDTHTYLARGATEDRAAEWRLVST